MTVKRLSARSQRIDRLAEAVEELLPRLEQLTLTLEHNNAEIKQLTDDRNSWRGMVGNIKRTMDGYAKDADEYRAKVDELEQENSFLKRQLQRVSRGKVGK